MKWVQRKKTIGSKNQIKGKEKRDGRTAKRRRERESQRKKVSREKTPGDGIKRERRGSEKCSVNSQIYRRQVEERIGARRHQKRSNPSEKEWVEERVRRGTGYRSTLETWQGQTCRKRDLGYGEPRRWRRPSGREVEIEKGTKRKRKAYGAGSRERVMGAAAERERRRPRSVYTGAGRSRKKKVGVRKLKSTKG